MEPENPRPDDATKAQKPETKKEPSSDLASYDLPTSVAMALQADADRDLLTLEAAPKAENPAAIDKPDPAAQTKLAALFQGVESQSALKGRVQSTAATDFQSLGVTVKPLADGTLGASVSFEFPHARQLRGDAGVKTNYTKSPAEAPSYKGEKIQTIIVTPPDRRNPEGTIVIETAKGQISLSPTERHHFVAPAVFNFVDSDGNKVAILGNGDKTIDHKDGTRTTQFGPFDGEKRQFKREVVNADQKSSVTYFQDGRRSIAFDPERADGNVSVTELPRGGAFAYEAKFLKPPSEVPENLAECTKAFGKATTTGDRNEQLKQLKKLAELEQQSPGAKLVLDKFAAASLENLGMVRYARLDQDGGPIGVLFGLGSLPSKERLDVLRVAARDLRATADSGALSPDQWTMAVRGMAFALRDSKGEAAKNGEVGLPDQFAGLLEKGINGPGREAAMNAVFDMIKLGGKPSVKELELAEPFVPICITGLSKAYAETGSFSNNGFSKQLDDLKLLSENGNRAAGLIMTAIKDGQVEKAAADLKAPLKDGAPADVRKGAADDNADDDSETFETSAMLDEGDDPAEKKTEKTPAQLLKEKDDGFDELLKRLDKEIDKEKTEFDIMSEALRKARAESLGLRIKSGTILAQEEEADEKQDKEKLDVYSKQLADLRRLDKDAENAERRIFEHLPEGIKARTMKSVVQISSGKDEHIEKGEMQLCRLVKENPQLATNKQFRDLVLLSYAEMAAARELRGLGEWKPKVKPEDVLTGKAEAPKDGGPADPIELLKKANQVFFQDDGGGIEKATPLFQQAIAAQKAQDLLSDKSRVQLFISSLGQDAKIAQNSQAGKDVQELVKERIAHKGLEEKAADKADSARDVYSSLRMNYAFARIASGKPTLYEDAVKDVMACLRDNPSMSFDGGFQTNCRQAFKAHAQNRKAIDEAIAAGQKEEPKPVYNDLDLNKIARNGGGKDAPLERYTSDDLTGPALTALGLGLAVAQFMRTRNKYHAANVMKESLSAAAEVKPIEDLRPDVRAERPARTGETAKFEIKGEARDGRLVLVRDAASAPSAATDFKEVKTGKTFDPAKLQFDQYTAIEVNGKQYFADLDGRVYKFEKKMLSDARLYEDSETRQIELVSRKDLKSVLPEIKVIPEALEMTHEHPHKAMPKEWQREFDFIRDAKRALAENDKTVSKRLEALDRAVKGLNDIAPGDRQRMVAELARQMEQVGIKIEFTDSAAPGGEMKLSLSETGSDRKLVISSDKDKPPSIEFKDNQGKPKTESGAVKVADELSRMEAGVSKQLKDSNVREKLGKTDPELAKDASHKEVRRSFLDGLPNNWREAREHVLGFQQAIKGADPRTTIATLMTELGKASPEVSQRTLAQLEVELKASGIEAKATVGQGAERSTLSMLAPDGKTKLIFSTDGTKPVLEPHSGLLPGVAVQDDVAFDKAMKEVTRKVAEGGGADGALKKPAVDTEEGSFSKKREPKVDTIADAQKNSTTQLDAIKKLLKGDKLTEAEAVMKRLDGMITAEKITPTAAIELQNMMVRAARTDRVLKPESLDLMAKLDAKAMGNVLEFNAALLTDAVNSGKYTVEQLNTQITDVDKFTATLNQLKLSQEMVSMSPAARTAEQASRILELGLDKNPAISKIFNDRSVPKSGVDALLKVLDGASTGNVELDKILTKDVVDRLSTSQSGLDHLKLLETVAVSGEILDGSLKRPPSVVQQLLDADSRSIREVGSLVRKAAIPNEQTTLMLKDILTLKTGERQYAAANGYAYMDPAVRDRVMKIENGDLRAALAQQSTAKLNSVEQVDKIVAAHDRSTEMGSLVRSLLSAESMSNVDKPALLNKVVDLNLTNTEAAKIAAAIAGDSPVLSVAQLKSILGDPPAARNAVLDLISSGKLKSGELAAAIAADPDARALARGLADDVVKEGDVRQLLEKERTNAEAYTREAPHFDGEPVSWKPNFTENDKVRDQIDRVRSVLKAHEANVYKLTNAEFADMISNPRRAFEISVKLPAQYHADPALAEVQRRALEHLERLGSKIDGETKESMRSFIEEAGRIKQASPKELADRMLNLEFLMQELKLNPELSREAINRYLASVHISSQIGQAETRALVSGLRQRMPKGAFEVFVHGSSYETAIVSASKQGENFDPNHPAKSPEDKSRIFTGTLEVTTEFAARLVKDQTRSRATDVPALVGIALPAEVAKDLSDRGLIWTRKLIDRDAYETIIEPSALEIIKEKGFIFPIDTETHVTLIDGVAPGQRGKTASVYSVPREAFDKMLQSLPAEHTVTVKDPATGKDVIRIRAGHEAEANRLILDAAKTQGLKPIKVDADGRPAPDTTVKPVEAAERRTGAVPHYDALPKTADKLVSEINERVAEVFKEVTREQFEKMDPVAKQKLIDSAVERIMPLMEQYAQRLGLPKDLINKNNITFDSLNNAGGVYRMGSDKLVIDIHAGFPANEAFHELVHKMRALDLKAAFQADPTGARLALMEKMLADGHARIRADGVIADRPKFADPKVAAEFRQLADYHILKQLNKTGHVDSSKIPPAKAPSAELLKAFGSSQADLYNAVANEVANFTEAVELIESSKLSKESSDYVSKKAGDFKHWLDNPKGSEVVRLAVHEVLTGPKLGSPAEQIKAVQDKIAFLTATKKGDKSTGVQVTEDVVKQMMESYSKSDPKIEALIAADSAIKFSRDGAASAEFSAPARSLRANPYVSKLFATASVDRIGRLPGGNPEYAFSNEEIAARKSDIAERARRLNRDIKTGQVPPEKLAESQKVFSEFVEYLRTAAEQQRLNRALASENFTEARALALKLQEKFASNPEYNKHAVEYLVINGLIKPEELHPAFKGLAEIGNGAGNEPVAIKEPPAVARERVEMETVDRVAKSTEILKPARRLTDGKNVDHIYAKGFEIVGVDGKAVTVKGIRKPLSGEGEVVYLVEGKGGRFEPAPEITKIAKERLGKNDTLTEALKDPAKASEILNRYAQASQDSRDSVGYDTRGQLVDYRAVARAAVTSFGPTATVEGTSVRFQSESGIAMVVKMKPPEIGKDKVKSLTDLDLTDEKLAKLLEDFKLPEELDKLAREKLEKALLEYLKDKSEARDFESAKKALAKEIREGRGGTVSQELREIFKQFDVEMEGGKPKFENGHLVLRLKTGEGAEPLHARVGGTFEKAKGKLVPIMMIILAVAHQSQDRTQSPVAPTR
ncbi:MAG: hypothetical protein SGJ27_28050 [Candidatus Melainabacteria bacterium]|nr:hypothetical protein [Candidatus Melainabacteria bacterium]